MARAICPGSAGELIEGIWEEKEVLISLTINRVSEMEVEIENEFIARTSASPLPKSQKALEIALRDWGFPHLVSRIGFRRLRSLPEGKGLSSSTADIAALLGALSSLVDHPLTEEEIARVALQVEPTDSTFFRGLCLFGHMDGGVIVRLPLPHYLGVVVVELPGTVLTHTVDREKFRRNWLFHRREIEEAYRLVERGLEEEDVNLLGRAASLSAQVMQEVEREPLFPRLLEIAEAAGAVGVNRAHTGRAFGVLFDPRVYSSQQMLERIRAGLAGEKVELWSARVISGGVRMINL
ncbi:MAG: L-threonine kinase [Candidatus Atribacteria bacterium]|nr:L-threonine kinase [Candidatus Atribacteria bacterium]